MAHIVNIFQVVLLTIDFLVQLFCSDMALPYIAGVYRWDWILWSSCHAHSNVAGNELNHDFELIALRLKLSVMYCFHFCKLVIQSF